MFAHALDMIFSTIAQFFMGLLLLRFAMQMRRTPFHHPFGQFILKTTNWAVLRLRRLIPAWRSYDVPTLVAAWLIGLLVTIVHQFLVETWPIPVSMPCWVALLALGWLEVGRMALVCLTGCLLVQVVLSWTQPFHPLMNVFRRLTGSLTGLLQKLIPPVAGVDLTPMVLILLAQVLLEFLIAPVHVYLVQVLTLGMFF